MKIDKREDLYNFIKANSSFEYSSNKEIRNKQFKIVDYYEENNCSELKEIAFCLDDEELLKINNIYALILYMILQGGSTSTYENMIIDIDTLRYVLGCNEKYKDWYNFKSRCISNPIRILKEKLKLSIDVYYLIDEKNIVSKVLFSNIDKL